MSVNPLVVFFSQKLACRRIEVIFLKVLEEPFGVGLEPRIARKLLPRFIRLMAMSVIREQVSGLVDELLEMNLAVAGLGQLAKNFALYIQKKSLPAVRGLVVGFKRLEVLFD